MDDFEGDQLVVGGRTAGDEEEGGIATVDDLGIYTGAVSTEHKRIDSNRTFVLKEVAHPGATRQNQLGHILDDLGLLLGGQSRKPFGEALRKLVSVNRAPRGDQLGGRRHEPLCPAATAG